MATQSAGAGKQVLSWWDKHRAKVLIGLVVVAAISVAWSYMHGKDLPPPSDKGYFSGWKQNKGGDPNLYGKEDGTWIRLKPGEKLPP